MAMAPIQTPSTISKKALPLYSWREVTDFSINEQLSRDVNDDYKVGRSSCEARQRRVEYLG